MTDAPQEEKKPKTVGQMITTLGVGMVTLSIVLAWAGVSGALFHNVLQLGGLALALVGVVMWKVLKK